MTRARAVGGQCCTFRERSLLDSAERHYDRALGTTEWYEKS